MNDITLYHGSASIVDSPICLFGREDLDFGKGFYLTTIRKQAEDWARKQTPDDKTSQPILNIYHFDREGCISHGRHKIFEAYNKEWLEFIVDSRAGKKPWLGYDYIEGGVVNDRVIDTVSLYMSGLIDIKVALHRLSMHQPNNQICILNQELLDKYLKFTGYEIIG